jgi:hypothetical protein
VRIAEVRAAADDLALHLRAARSIAVTGHTTIPFTVEVDPVDLFKYIGSDGNDKEIDARRVRIAPASARSINFKERPVDVASIILESTSPAPRSGGPCRNTAGLTKLDHERRN